VPLLELAPDLVLPGTGEALASLPVAVRGVELEPLAELTRTLKGMVQG
jgi:hypothetical protein